MQKLSCESHLFHVGSRKSSGKHMWQ